MTIWAGNGSGYHYKSLIGHKKILEQLLLTTSVPIWKAINLGLRLASWVFGESAFVGLMTVSKWPGKKKKRSFWTAVGMTTQTVIQIFIIQFKQEP